MCVCSSQSVGTKLPTHVNCIVSSTTQWRWYTRMPKWSYFRRDVVLPHFTSQSNAHNANVLTVNWSNITTVINVVDAGQPHFTTGCLWARKCQLDQHIFWLPCNGSCSKRRPCLRAWVSHTGHYHYKTGVPLNSHASLFPACISGSSDKTNNRIGSIRKVFYMHALRDSVRLLYIPRSVEPTHGWQRTKGLLCARIRLQSFNQNSY